MALTFRPAMEPPIPARPPILRSLNPRLWIVVGVLALVMSCLSLFRDQIVRKLRIGPSRAPRLSGSFPGTAFDVNLPDSATMSGIKLGFRFQLPASDRPGVLVQTSTTSSGLTLGYAGKSLVLSLPNDHSDPAGVAFGGDLAPDRWHDLTLRGEFGVNLTITLDNKVVHTGPFERPDFAANRLRLGSALDDTRHFEGQFIAPHLSVIRPRETAVSYFVYGRLILFGLMVYIILRMSQSAATPLGGEGPTAPGANRLSPSCPRVGLRFVSFGHILLVAFPPLHALLPHGPFLSLLRPMSVGGGLDVFHPVGLFDGQGFLFRPLPP